jgi:hypothetical protein
VIGYTLRLLHPRQRPSLLQTPASAGFLTVFGHFTSGLAKFTPQEGHAVR